jgi:hypothetical protein
LGRVLERIFKLRQVLAVIEGLQLLDTLAVEVVALLDQAAGFQHLAALFVIPFWSKIKSGYSSSEKIFLSVALQKSRFLFGGTL